jgi:serine phosphatase RsbU (regulator of sigma subunit)/anti-sigma regulatory factor (Ser/Thr protein kinase)
MRDRQGEYLGPEEEFPQAGDLSRLMLASILEYSGVGVAMLNRSLVYTWCNDALTYGGQLPRERRIGRRPAEVLPGELAKLVDRALQQVLETGVPVLNYELIGPSPVSQRLHSWWFCAFRIDDDRGEAVGAWYMIADQSAERRARTRLQLLNRASERIGSTLDVAQTAQELADVAVPDVADLVTVELLEPVLRGDEPQPVPEDGPVVLARSGLRSVLGRSPELPGAGDLLRLPAGTAIRRCLTSGEPVVISAAARHAEQLASEPDWVARLPELGVASVCAVPVRARGVILGVALFCRRAGAEPHDEEDVSLAVELAARAAVCLDNARRFQRERRSTLALQRSLLPSGLHGTPALEVASRYLPATGPAGLGGDWVDVIPLSGGRVALVVGDVVGHGAAAAAAMGQMSTAVRTLAGLDLPPAELLAHLDDRVTKLAEQGPATPWESGAERPLGEHVLGTTCLYVVYDPVTRRCAAATAGHPAPAVVDGGNVSFVPLPTGPPLGLGVLPYESADFMLPDGTLLALFTNGLVGSRGHDIDGGLARLAGDLARPASSVEEVSEHVIEPVLNTPAQDDVALIVARAQGLDAAHVAAWDLPSDPVHVRDARELAGRQLAEWGWGDLALTCELVVSELVTNAIRYGRPPIRLLLIRQEPDMLICEVSDGSSTSPHLRRAGATDENGRGLFLISQVAHRWGTRYTESGKTIWVEQHLEAAAGLT